MERVGGFQGRDGAPGRRENTAPHGRGAPQQTVQKKRLKKVMEDRTELNSMLCLDEDRNTAKEMGIYEEKNH